MSRLSITREALLELSERIAASAFGRRGACGVCIVGPLDDRSWSYDDLEEAWQLEKLYGKPQRWSIHLMPLGARENVREAIDRNLHIEEVGGITFEVWTSPPAPRLKVELHGDVLHVFEIDA